MHWAKTRPSAPFDLAGSNVLACTIEDIAGALDALSLAGRNENGYAPLVEAIAARYGVAPDHVTTAQGTAGANFLVFAALLGAGDEVLVERPGYDPLLGAARVPGANVVRFERRFEDRYALDPGSVAALFTPRTRLVVITSPHNPAGTIADRDALAAIGRHAESHGAHVLVDEVYMDVATRPEPAAATLGDVFISTSSLTKSYGLSGLRCGWVLSSPEVAERVRRTRDVVDGTGSIVAERLSVVAFAQIDRLLARARTLLDANQATVTAFLRGRPDLEWIAPLSGTVAFPRVHGMDDTTEFADRLLRERGTAVVPGRFFESPRHFRLGYAIEHARLVAGLQALGAALDDVRA